MSETAKTELTVNALRDFAKPTGASFAVLLAYFGERGYTRYVTWGSDPGDKVVASNLSEEISQWINEGGSSVLDPATGPAVVHESFKLDAARNKARADQLEEEVKRLQAVKDYVHARLDTAGVTVDPESPHKEHGCRIGGRLDELIGERDNLRQQVSRLTRQLLRSKILGEVELPELANVRRANFIRVGGNVVCERCNVKYYDHPADPHDECLNILCDRTRVKL